MMYGFDINEKRALFVRNITVNGLSAGVGGKYTNMGGKLKMRGWSVGGKCSEEYIYEN